MESTFPALIALGASCAIVGDEILDYDHVHCLVTVVDLLVRGRHANRASLYQRGTIGREKVEIRMLRSLRRGAVLLGTVLMALLALRIYDALRGPPLEIWHTEVPEEFSAELMDRADWDTYLAWENKIFDELHVEIKQELAAEDRVPINRYFEGSPIYPEKFPRNWNRSFAFEPDGAPVGAVVLLHGLTDSPYSLRHIARLYRSHGFVAVAPRLPAHGTVPAALSDIAWEDWAAATRLAVREARRRIGSGRPLHIVGYSLGGSLAMNYALDAIENPALAPPDKFILISPMVGITAFARFAGLAGLPAVLPAFAKTAWVSVLPEYNPFKYNSFPVNAARQPYLLTQEVQQQIMRQERRSVAETPANSDVSVSDGLHRQPARCRIGVVYASPGKRERTGAV